MSSSFFGAFEIRNGASKKKKWMLCNGSNEILLPDLISCVFLFHIRAILYDDTRFRLTCKCGYGRFPSYSQIIGEVVFLYVRWKEELKVNFQLKHARKGEISCRRSSWSKIYISLNELEVSSYFTARKNVLWNFCFKHLQTITFFTVHMRFMRSKIVQ